MDSQERSAEPQSSPVIHQQAGDGATQIGEVMGDLNIHHHYQTAQASKVALDLAAYREYQLSQLAIWERQYTRLDADPIVALAGQDLRPAPDSRLPLTEAFVRQKRLVVLGGAGAGKTTSLLYLARSVLNGEALTEGETDFLPVFIELGRFRSDAASSPLDNLLTLIADALYLGKACPEPPSLRDTRELLTSHRLLLLMDGLNEAQAGIRRSCLAAIDDLAIRYPDHRFVLSSRPHGFSPPEGWDIVLLRELEDAQIPEFVGRYTPAEVSPTLLQTVLETQNPLLRLPLFLSLFVRMNGSPLLDHKRKLRSRSGLVAEYVESLLGRDLTKGNSSPADVLGLDQLRSALELLAQAFQASGQVLPLADARTAVAAGGALGDTEEVARIIEELCERGLLATDGKNLRFWHQTIQEYFYAGSIVLRWRGSGKQVGRIPWPLRRLFAKPDEEEALSFMVAHLRAEEADAALRYGLPVNPALAISWADDLSLEGRAAPATNLFPTRMRRFASAVCRYSRLGSDRRLILPLLGLLSLLWPLLLRELALNVSVGPYGPKSPMEEYILGILLACVASVGYLLFLDASLRFSSVKKLEAALGAVPQSRDPSLRRSLCSLFLDVSQSRLVRRDLRSLARSVSEIEAITGQGLIELLRASDSLYVTTRLLGHLETPLAVPLLGELLKLNNAFSLAALQALSTRADRLRDERQAIKTLFSEAWKNSHLDWNVRRLARKSLLRLGERPYDRGILARYFSLRILRALALLAGSCLAICLGIGIGVPLIVLAAEEFKVWRPLVGLALALQLWLPILIWWDARRIGARNISGYWGFDGFAPHHWAVSYLSSALVFFVLFSMFGLFSVATLIAPVLWLLPASLIPTLYLLNRQRIGRNAMPMNWAALERMPL